MRNQAKPADDLGGNVRGLASDIDGQGVLVRPGGSSVVICESSRVVGMKWSVRAAKRCPIWLLEPAR